MGGDWCNSIQASIRFELDDYYIEDDGNYDGGCCRVATKKASTTKSANSTSSSTIGTCPICFESMPVHKIVKSCKHASACWECLRAMYVTTSQTSVTNYPLRCFGLGCRKTIGEHNLIKLGLFQNDGELQRHRELGILSNSLLAYSDLAKSHRFAGGTTINCPSCYHPRHIQTKATFHNRSHHTYRCQRCKHGYVVDTVLVDRPTIYALESNNGKDGWASCPRCGILVTKEGGCDTMVCVCSKEFDWRDALTNREKHRILTHEVYTFHVQSMTTVGKKSSK